jgi:hypothetical protein
LRALAEDIIQGLELVLLDLSHDVQPLQLLYARDELPILAHRRCIHIVLPLHREVEVQLKVHSVVRLHIVILCLRVVEVVHRYRALRHLS